MSAVLRDLLDSPLADAYGLEVIPTYRSPRPLQRMLVFARALMALMRWCRGAGVRLVHVHTAARGSLYRKAICVAVVKSARRPVILHVHAGAGDLRDFANRLGPLRRALLRGAFRSADRVLSVSSNGAREIERLFAVEEVLAVPNAAPRVAPTTSDRPRGEEGVEAVRILYMGGFSDPAKGGELLVRALPAIVSRLPHAEITLAGPGAPPPALNRLLEVHPGLGWVGWLEGGLKAEMLGRCDIFMLPSISEGLPVALLEAMRYGRPIVASRVGGIPDVLEHDVNALLVPPGDPVALAAAVEALASAPQIRATLGRAARDRADGLSRDGWVRIEAVYRELLG
jgi:glycosyltransferase involved in cell wall biosynthesis